MASYLILGEGKSGTTALYTSVLRNVPEPVSRYFEPDTLASAVKQMTGTSVVAKALIDGLHSSELPLVRQFDRTVLIVRDPRDTLVSRLLYRVRDMRFIYDEARTETFLQAIREKEADPASHSVIDLYEMLESLSGVTGILQGIERVHHKTVNVSRALYNELHVLRYEDFIANSCERVSEFLGLAISSEIEVEERFRRVTRTKARGDWAHWFLPRDVEYARDAYREFMEMFGYNDWAQPARRIIESRHASDYVARIIMLKRTRRG